MRRVFSNFQIICFNFKEEERIAKEEDEKLKQKADKERKEKEAALKATKKKEEAGADVKSEK